jgi:hypothetical protein
MQEQILKAQKNYLVTFAAVALVGWGVLQLALPISADDVKQYGHSMDLAFRTYTENVQHHNQIKRMLSLHNARLRRSEAISEFLGVSDAELRKRINGGDSLQNIAEERGKTREDFRAYILDYMQKHKLRDTS